MIIDNEKFITLLTSNLGIEQEKVEAYLKELIDDIQNAINEDEAYEIEDFGIFSKLGNNILFIPSENLETEINYKYVGMEPLVISAAPSDDTGAPEEIEDQIEGFLDDEIEDDIVPPPPSSANEYADPFAEIFDEVENEEDIEAAVEEEIENETVEDIFNAISEEDEDEPFELDDELAAFESAEDESIEEFDHTFSDDLENDADDSDDDMFEESEPTSETPTADEEEHENDDQEQSSIPGPENWGIDAHKEENQENAFSGLLGDDTNDDDSFDDEGLENIFGDNSDDVDDDEELDFSALEESNDTSLENDNDQNETNDFVPIVTNVSTSKTKKAGKKDDSLDAQEESTAKEKSPDRKLPSERKKASPVALYLVLTVLILGFAGYLLAFFGIININGITPQNKQPQVAQTTVPPPTTSQPAVTTPEEPEETTAEPTNSSVSQKEKTGANNSSNEPIIEENQNNRREGLAPLVADEKSPGDGGRMTTSKSTTSDPNQAIYGLTGSLTEAGNNGYTIVLYTLSRKAGVDEQRKMLSEKNYRVLVKEKSSAKYGTLYRVSIGQFETLADAAVAAEQIDKNILGNYIITKI